MNKSLILLLMALMSMGKTTTAQSRAFRIIAYFPEWGIEHRPPYYVKDIVSSGAADRLTDLIYAFSEPAPDFEGGIEPQFMNAYEAYQQIYSAAMSVDGVADDSTQPLRGELNQIRKLKLRYPNLKVLISIGGWTGSAYFSLALETPSSRRRFADAIINRYILGNLPKVGTAGGERVAAGIFDGVDIDWEFPVSGGNAGNNHNPKDAQHLTEFLALMREKLDSIDRNLLLTEAVPSGETALANYQIEKDQEYLSWFNLMTYDFTGAWNPVTGFHTNLLTPAEDTSANSLDRAVKYFLDSLKVQPAKIVPGAAFYGRGWRDVGSKDDGLFQHASGAAQGEYESGIQDFSLLMPLLREGYEYHWDPSAMAPWLYSPADRIFWSMDDAKSIALKYHYAVAYHLGGIMSWEISGDDSSGTLIKAMATGEMPEARRFHYKAESEKGVNATISISVPSPIIAAGSNVILDAWITGQSKNIVRVEFFVDGKTIGYDTEAPFDWVWFNATKGVHTIEAVAFDGVGNRTTSNTVSIKVK